MRNLWCSIRAEEKVGILGENEATKHALVAIITRLVDVIGIVRIDGLDMSELGLKDMREQITMIQQSPALFSGSLRRNLDPLISYPDALLWKALADVQLKRKVT